MFKVQTLLAVAVSPLDPNSAWFTGAAAGVEYLVENARSGEIILYTNVGQSLVHAILAPLANVTPPDGHALQHALVNAFNHWRLEHVSGGGKPDRMYLASPIDTFGCKGLEGGQQLVFRRSFTDVDNGPPRTELSQPLVQALDLYWLDEQGAYCRLNDDGDVEPIIRLRDLSTETGEVGAILVTIEAEQLHRYMAVTETALVMKFDFTRYVSGSFAGWDEPKRDNVDKNDLFYHVGVQPGASFANGALIVHPLLTTEMLIARANCRWDRTDKEYATFKARDWKNKRSAEISCAPWALASYFDKGSPLPFQTTPAFFKAEVLQKYKADPDKYRLEHRSIHARGGWYLKSYDVNEEGQVHAYLCDLANLPYREQLYWKSFNEWPKAGISARAFQTDFEGSFSTIPDPLVDLKYEIAKLDKLQLDWWSPRGETASAALHYPLTASREEWANAVLALDQLVVEGLVVKGLRSRLESAARTVDKQWASLRLLQDCLVLAGLDEADAIAVLEPLKRTHTLRSKVKGHLAESVRQAIIKQAQTEHGSLAAHFRSLVEEVQASFDRIVGLL
jgi:HAMP domain-containing protein